MQYSKVELLQDIKNHREALTDLGVPIVECQPLLDRLIRTMGVEWGVTTKGTKYTKFQSLELLHKRLQEIDYA